MANALARPLVAAAVGLGVLAAGAPALAAPSAPAATHATALSSKTRHGHSVLVAGSKFVYVHVNSKGRNVACTGSCLKSWPTVTSAARPKVSSGVRSAHVARNAHHDVTYYKLRLYYFSFDVLGGSALGDHVNSFGGTWRLINTAGKLS